MFPRQRLGTGHLHASQNVRLGENTLRGCALTSGGGSDLR
jgi:hypothetical protein